MAMTVPRTEPADDENARVARGIAATLLQRKMRDFVYAGATEEQIVETLEGLAVDAATNQSYHAGVRDVEPQSTRDLRAEAWLLRAARQVASNRRRTGPTRRQRQQHHEDWRASLSYRSPDPTGRPEQFGGPPVDGRQLLATLARHIEALRLSGRHRGSESAFRAVNELLEQAIEGA